MGIMVSRTRGFTLVEIMIVVGIVGLLAAIAIPVFNAIRTSSQATRMVTDFKTYRTAFEMHAFEMGTWPVDADRGTIPGNMNVYLKGNSFAQTTPIGGNWDWDFDQSFAYAGLSVVDSTAGEGVMEKIDEMIDDGDLSSGEFQKTEGTRYTLILEEY